MSSVCFIAILSAKPAHFDNGVDSKFPSLQGDKSFMYASDSRIRGRGFQVMFYAREQKGLEGILARKWDCWCD